MRGEAKRGVRGGDPLPPHVLMAGLMAKIHALWWIRTSPPR